MADKHLEEKEECSIEKTQLEDEPKDTCQEGESAKDLIESGPKQTTEHDTTTTTDSTNSDKYDEEETLKMFEITFKNRFTELDPGYLPYKSSNDAESIPVVENFPPPWNSQNRRDDFRGRGHGSRHHHHHQNRYKRRHEEYRSHDNRRGRDSHHSNYQEERRHWQRQDHYYGHREYEHSTHSESRDQGYRRY